MTTYIKLHLYWGKLACNNLFRLFNHPYLNNFLDQQFSTHGILRGLVNGK